MASNLYLAALVLWALCCATVFADSRSDLAAAPEVTPLPPRAATTAWGWRYPAYDRAGTGSDETAYAAVTEPFREIWRVTLPAAGVGVRTGDVNGDAVLDIVVFGGRELRILDAQGNLEAPPVALPVDVGSVILEDLDSDGANEILVGSRNTAVLQINIYSGDGALRRTIIGRSADPSDPAVGLDPVAYLGDGRLAALYTAGLSRTPRGYAVFDITDGDTGDELFFYDMGPQPVAASVGELGGDGVVAFVATVLSSEDGAFGSGIGGTGTTTSDANIYTIVVDELGREVLVQLLGENTVGGAKGRGQHVIVDLDGNGTTEIVAAAAHYAPEFPGDAQLRVINGTGQLLRKVSVGPDADPRFLVADLNGNGAKEVIVGDAGRRLSVYAAELSLENRTADAGTQPLAVADVDGDRRKEILMADAGTLKMLNSDQLAEESVLTFGSDVYAAVTSDVDADGTAEILVATANGDVRLFAATPVPPPPPPPQPALTGGAPAPQTLVVLALLLWRRLRKKASHHRGIEYTGRLRKIITRSREVKHS